MGSNHRPGRHRDGTFTCVCCKQPVPTNSYGTQNRNHCPACLWSRHVDAAIGDRNSGCNQPMEPIAIMVGRGGEWSIVHRCTGCGTLRHNRIAGDDLEMPLLWLALRPIANPAFPLDGLPGVPK